MLASFQSKAFMKTFTARIIYKIECEGIRTEQYEEQWRLIYADDELAALEHAREAAAAEESSFPDRHGRIVNWKLLAVKDLQETSLHNGALLFSTIKEMEPMEVPVWTY
jgi:hypothetical protein